MELVTPAAEPISATGPDQHSAKCALTVLIIEDEPQIRRLLRAALEHCGWRVVEADHGRAGISEAAISRPDAVILDLGLPDMDGQEVIARIREWSGTPILVLSVREKPEARILALDAGADDFVPKPFNTGEVLARLRALRRRREQPAEHSEVACGPLRMDLAARRVTVAGHEIHLTPIEYALLKSLVRNVGKVVTQGYILREVWGPDGDRYRNHLRVHLTHLRKKLTGAGFDRTLLHTEPGVGYRLTDCRTSQGPPDRQN